MADERELAGRSSEPGAQRALEQLHLRLRALEAGQTGRVTLAGAGVADPGHLACDGSVYERDEYPALFGRISTIYNTGGETATQFRVPNFAAGAFAPAIWQIKG